MLDVKKLWELEQQKEKLQQERKFLMVDSKKYEWYTKEIEILDKEINDSMYSDRKSSKNKKMGVVKMRINIVVTKWNNEEIVLKFGANNRLIKNTENFMKDIEVSQVINEITKSIVNDNREFRKFELVGVHA